MWHDEMAARYTLIIENAFSLSSISWRKVRMPGIEERNSIFCLSWHYVSNFLVDCTLSFWMVKITFWGRPRAFRLDLLQARPWDSTSVDVDEKSSILLERGSLWAEEGTTDLNELNYLGCPWPPIHLQSKQIHICLAIFVQYPLNHLWVEPPFP